MSNSRTFKQRMRDKQLPTRTVPINTAGHLVARHAELNRQLQEALESEPAAKPQRAGTKAPAVSPEVLELTEQVEAVEAEMDDSWQDFVLTGKPWNVWRDFKQANPPQITGGLEQRFEIDSGAVVRDFLRDCITSPDIDDEDWANMLAGGIWPGDLDTLAAHVIGMHEVGLNVVPKSRLTLAVRETYDAASEQLSASASHIGASTGGSPGKSTSTTALTGS